MVLVRKGTSIRGEKGVQSMEGGIKRYEKVKEKGKQKGGK